MIILALWPFLSSFISSKGSRRGHEALMGRQFNSVQCVCWFLSHFSTAGLCNMPVGVFSRPLLTTGDYGIQAERGSSLLQGGSGSEEGLRSNPPPQHIAAVGSPPFAGFPFTSCPKRERIWTKLGRKGVLVKPH